MDRTSAAIAFIGFLCCGFAQAVSGASVHTDDGLSLTFNESGQVVEVVHLGKALSARGPAAFFIREHPRAEDFKAFACRATLGDENGIRETGSGLRPHRPNGYSC